MKPEKCTPIQANSTRPITVEEIKRFSVLSAHYHSMMMETNDEILYKKYKNNFDHYQKILKVGEINTYINE